MALEKIYPLELIKNNPRMYLNYAGTNGFELCSKILIDALTNDVWPIKIDRQDDWWLVTAGKSWIRDNPDSIPVRDLFCRIWPNPRAGPNAMRNEVLLTVFASEIVLIERGEVEVIQMTRDVEVPSSIANTEDGYLFGVAFTVP